MARTTSRRDRTHRVANPERNAAMVALRSSGAAGPHADKRTRRTRTRSAARTAALRDQ